MSNNHTTPSHSKCYLLTDQCWIHKVHVQAIAELVNAGGDFVKVAKFLATISLEDEHAVTGVRVGLGLVAKEEE